MDETIYNRSLARGQQPVPKSRLLRLVGVEQWRARHLRQNLFQALMRPVIAISKLPVLLCTIYYFLSFAWVVGVGATISIWLTDFYKFTLYNIGASHIFIQSEKRIQSLTPAHPRLLLLRLCKRRCHRRSPWPLATRPRRRLLPAPTLRPHRARSPPHNHLARHPHHGRLHPPPRLRYRTYLSLHGARRFRRRASRWHHDRDRRAQRVPSGCLSRGKWRGGCVDRGREDDGRLHGYVCGD